MHIRSSLCVNSLIFSLASVYLRLNSFAFWLVDLFHWSSILLHLLLLDQNWQCMSNLEENIYTHIVRRGKSLVKSFQVICIIWNLSLFYFVSCSSYLHTFWSSYLCAYFVTLLKHLYNWNNFDIRLNFEITRKTSSIKAKLWNGRTNVH